MHWLFLLFAFTMLAFAFLTTSMQVLSGCLLAALAFFLLWAYGLYRSRFADTGRDMSSMLDPDELRRLREQAQARKQSQDAP